MKPRYDADREIYRECKWCQGRGCLYCATEANKAFKAAFPGGAQPIASFDLSTPEGVECARRAIGAGAMQRAFGPGGGGVSEILQNCRAAQESGA